MAMARGFRALKRLKAVPKELRNDDADGDACDCYCAPCEDGRCNECECRGCDAENCGAKNCSCAGAAQSSSGKLAKADLSVYESELALIERGL